VDAERLDELERGLAGVLSALSRPAGRSKRRHTVASAVAAIGSFLAGVPDVSEAPLSLSDLGAVIPMAALVDSGEMSPADWKQRAMNAARQALSEVQARRLMIEESEIVLMFAAA
jgi:hypothetical protein